MSPTHSPKQTAWTPGPWAVEDPMDHCLTIVANPDGPVYDWKWVATLDWPDEDNHDLTSSEVKANANLIAAAPELYEALKRSAEGWANALELGLLPPQHRNAATILRDEAWAALSKARPSNRGEG